MTLQVPAQASQDSTFSDKYITMPGARGLSVVIISAAFAIVTWVAYLFIQPPRPKICGTRNGPPVTASRIKLKDGRFLAYKEAGVPKNEAKYKIVVVHGYGGSGKAVLRAVLKGFSEGLMSELQIYIVAFDRAGYGQSTPFPQRTIKSDAFDVQELADGLELGSTFYLATSSMGGGIGYGVMKYLPHRLAGVVMIAPAVNFWWPGFLPSTAHSAFSGQAIGDRMALRICHYAPWLVYWFMNQKMFPTSSFVQMEKAKSDKIRKLRNSGQYSDSEVAEALEPTQQGKDESQYRDFKNFFGAWEFDPFQLQNPFSERKGFVHIWQGDDDSVAPVSLQREVVRALPWVQYHEIPGANHFLLAIPGQADVMIRALCQE